MNNIIVGRYDKPDEVKYAGWIEPEDRSWVIFVKSDNTPLVYLNRTNTGAII